MKRSSKTFFLICLLSIGAAPNARATDDSCATVNLADPNPQIPLEKRPLSVMPILDQGPSDTCYAQVAAEKVDALRFSHGDKDIRHFTDPWVLAAQASRMNPWNTDKLRKPDGTIEKEMTHGAPGNFFATFDHGALTLALRAAYENGSCPSSLFSDSIARNDPKSGMNKHYKKIQELINRYHEWAKLKDDTSRVHRDLASLHPAPARPEVLGQVCAWMRDVYGIHPSQLPDTGWIESVLQNDNPLILLDEMFQTACKASGKVKPIRLPPLKSYKTQDFMWIGTWDPPYAAKSLIAERLYSTHPQPPAVNLCAQIFKDPGYKGVGFQFNDMIPSYKETKDCEIHSVLIAGRRRNPSTGKCQLIIRNSWGPKSCEEKRWDQPQGGRNKWDCLRGDFLVDEDVVYRNTTQVAYFEE